MSILSKYDLFIFDWDGTLCYSPVLSDVLHFFVKEFRIRTIDSTANLDINLDAAEKAVERESKIVAELYEVYDTFFKAKPMPNAVQLLSFLKKKRKKMTIFSDGTKYRLFKETRNFGLAKYMDLILSASSIDCYKPNPTGLLLIARKLKVSRKRCLYVGDMNIDVRTAKFAGMDSCAVASGLDPYATLKGEKPTHLFRNLSAFLTAME